MHTTMPTIRRISGASSYSTSDIRTTLNEPKEHEGFISLNRRSIGISFCVLTLVIAVILQHQDRVLLMDAFQDCIYDVEDYKRDLQENVEMIDSLERDLERKHPSYGQTMSKVMVSRIRPYRLADALLLTNTIENDQIMSYFQEKYHLEDSPLISQCGVVMSRDWNFEEVRRKAKRKIAIISSWSPRPCGIATYSSKLVEGLQSQSSIGSEIDVIAVRNPEEPQNFFVEEAIVKISFQRDILSDYHLVSKFINKNGYDTVILSYEFGIYGDEYIMCLLKQIEKSHIITIMHTIANNLPWKIQALTEQVVMLSHSVVVMTDTMKRELEYLHQVPSSLVQVIPHGVPSMSTLIERLDWRTFEKVSRRYWALNSGRVLFSNGLLHQGKGIELVISAMPAILNIFPDAKYVIQGAPHPTGEGTHEYYKMLKDMVIQNHLERSVLFYPEFIPDSKLVERLSYSSIFINAYVDQVASVSGTLIMAMGVGVPCVSTPYPFAREMMSDQSGILVPFSDSNSIYKAVVYLLSNPELALDMGRRAKQRTKSWENVASMFLNVAHNSV